MTDDPGAPRQTLAQRLAERNRQRALRAERLARLHGADAGAPPARAAADAAEAALEDFLRALTGDRAAAPAGPPVEPGEILRFPRPEPPPAAAGSSDLERLPGVGPGLVWALERAGVRRLADLVDLAPAELAARLGPLGRLVPAEAWIARARRETAEA